MTLAHSPLWTPLFALDRLNSWVRTREPFCLAPRDCLKPVIYWTKTNAILDVSKRWHIGLRRVMVKKPCRKCDGTGIWAPMQWGGWEEDTYEEYRANYGKPCWTCQARGTVHLKFIETTIGPLRWHTPAEKWYSSSLDVYLPFKTYWEQHDRGDSWFEEETNGWEPNQPGRPLQNDDALRDAIIVLNEWPHEVCFSIDYHFHAGLERTWNCPDVRKAEDWLRDLFAGARPARVNFE